MIGRKFRGIYRTILLDGSPANRVAKWTLTILITGAWIYKSEKKNPRRKGIFLGITQLHRFYNMK